MHGRTTSLFLPVVIIEKGLAETPTMFHEYWFGGNTIQDAVNDLQELLNGFNQYLVRVEYVNIHERDDIESGEHFYDGRVIIRLLEHYWFQDYSI